MMNKDTEVERLRAEMDSAQNDIASAKAALDSISASRNGYKSLIEQSKCRIDDIRRSMEREYQDMKYCYQCHDRYSAENHKYNAQSYRDSLNREREIKNGYIEQKRIWDERFHDALADLNSARERKQRAREAFNERLSRLRAERERQQAMWREKACKCCGRAVRYRVDWSKVPDLCPGCKEKAARRPR